LRLTPAADNTGKIYFVKNSSGIWPLNKPAGFYFSNGTTWTQAPMTAGALTTADVIDNLISTVTNKPLSANQGFVLKGLIDAINNEFEERVDDEVNALIQDNTGITWIYDDILGTLTPVLNQNLIDIVNAAATSGNILIGSGTGWLSKAMSGEATLLNTGAITLNNAAVIGKVLTGYVSGAGTVLATDSISKAIQKLNGNDTPVNSTVVITGGYLTIGSPKTTFSISDGSGMITNNTVNPPTLTQVSWSGLTNIPATFIAAGVASYIAIDSTGSVVQQLAPFTNEQRRDVIFLGSMFHANLTTIDDINQFSEVGISPVNQLSDLAVSIGKFNLEGNIFSPNGANLQINKSIGKLFAFGSNWAIDGKNPHIKSLPALTSLTFQYRFQNGTNGATGVNINPNIYDLNGVSTAVPTNKFTIQRVFLYVSQDVKIQPGQNVYGSLAEAKAAIQTETFNVHPPVAANGILRAYIIVRQGTTNLQSATDCAFFFAGKFPDQNGASGISVSNFQNVYDNSAPNPELTIDAVRGALTIKTYTGGNGVNVLEIQNDAGTTTFSVNGNGEIIGFAQTQPQSDNSTKLATTGFAKRAAFINSLIF
jgi:hypothetical protein